MSFKKSAFILCFLLGICLVPWSAMAGGDPAVVRRPAPPHHFLDGPNILSIGASIGLMAADVATTQRALRVPGAHEVNPLARNQSALIGLKVGSVGAGIVIAYALHKSGHHKAERVIPMLFSIPSGVAAIHNAGIHP